MSDRAHIISVIPVYNGERFIEATLDSLAAQTLKPDRVIVLDDASTDDTAQLVEAYQSLKCEIVRCKQNQGGIDTKQQRPQPPLSFGSPLQRNERPWVLLW